MVHVFLVVAVMGYLELVNSAYSDTSETREVLQLNGIWNCYCERDGKSLDYREQHGLRKLNGIVKMPVPGSKVDFAAHIDPKSCSGVVWFERSFFVPKTWKYEKKIFLRLDGIATDTEVWINGEVVEKGTTQYLECDVTDKLVYFAENHIALAVTKMFKSQGPYPGIPQSINLRIVPEILFVQSVSVGSTVKNETALITFKAIAGGLLRHNPKCISVQVLDKDNTQVAMGNFGDSLEGSFTIPDCNLWWPMCMDSKSGYLYTLVFKLFYKYCESEVKDVYRMKIGIRPLRWSNNSWMLNEKSFYLQGVEASDAWAQKPFSPSMNLKDISMLKWLHANALVTNVAPLEETLDITDELGLFVILGSPKSALEEVIVRYRHHPSVIMWSILDEHVVCNTTKCDLFDDSFIDRVRFLDSTRPFTSNLATSTADMSAKISKLDIISFNIDDDNLKNAKHLRDTIERFKKPFIVMHGNKFLSSNNRIRTLNYNPVDGMRDGLEHLKRDYAMVGEFYGNFVAYERMEDESVNLVNGIFNRNREPTAGADFVRSKFRPSRGTCPRRTPRCGFSRKLRRRIVK